jgi:DNA recombination protein RmuC
MTMQTGTTLFSLPLLELNGHMVTLGESLLATLMLIAVWLGVGLARSSRRRATAEADAAERTALAEARLAEILKAQSEMQGRMGAMAELFGARQAELNQSIGQRIDGMTQRLGSSITEQTRSTTRTSRNCRSGWR